jgi:phosphopantothenoylcysteine synthetase/decarboxylase
MAPPSDITNNASEQPAIAEQPGTAGPLSGRRIVVALSGGIACYKTATLVSRLVQEGADVRVLMTDAATRFVGPLTFQSLSGKPVLTSVWQSNEHPDSQHVGVARWCELMVVAPGTADLIAKLAHGLAGDVVTLVACALPSKTPLLVAPSMNADMWANAIVQKNVATLKELPNCQLIGPDDGWQACRTKGAGRMSEPGTIYKVIEKQFSRK